jgi:hypothetical protein
MQASLPFPGTVLLMHLEIQAQRDYTMLTCSGKVFKKPAYFQVMKSGQIMNDN